MHHILDMVVSSFLLLQTIPPGDLMFPNAPASSYGGLMIVRQGSKTTWSLGGGLFPRHIKSVTATPGGPVVTRFQLPGNAQQRSVPLGPLFAEARPAGLWVEVPEPSSVLYVEGEMVHGHGKQRALVSPPLAPGNGCVVRLRVTSLLGNHFVIEDRQVFIRPGDMASVTFDGSQALTVPMLPTSSTSVR